ncbi:MAG: hypothetical protein Q8908_15380 [Bacteroidota bacterium]|nr:hypothetical protein [Bacteroidota bacterium]
MRLKLVKLRDLSGNMASVYGVWCADLQKTSFDNFLDKNKNLFKSELKSIISRLKIIGNETGARETYFKINEGVPGDGVCALYDSPDKRLRLYCIRYGTLIVIVGGGGPKNVRKLQQNPKLKDENYFLREFSAQITERLKEGDLWYSEDYMNFEGNLEFDYEPSMIKDHKKR